MEADEKVTSGVLAGEHGEVWGSRLEVYLSDPAEEPNMAKWVTRLAFRLAQ